jgi:hypothetical protein
MTYASQRILVRETAVAGVAFGMVNGHLDVVSPRIAAREVTITESAISCIDIKQIRHGMIEVGNKCAMRGSKRL